MAVRSVQNQFARNPVRTINPSERKRELDRYNPKADRAEAIPPKRALLLPPNLSNDDPAMSAPSPPMPTPSPKKVLTSTEELSNRPKRFVTKDGVHET